MFAIDWDHHELRYVKAKPTRTGRSAQVVDAGRVAFDPNLTPREQLQAALKEVTAGAKANVVVALGVGSIETATISVPPASDAELPTLVQNLCRQQMTFAEEEPALDFLADEPADDGTRSVTAMLLREENLSPIRDALESCGATAEKVLLRPHALAAFLTKGSGLRIAVSVARGLCDMLIVSEDRVVAVRSLRIPPDGSPEQLGRHCAGELNRTMFATLEEPAADAAPLELLVLGEGKLATELATALTADFGTEASLRDPLENAKGIAVEDSGSLAALVGALSPQFAPPVDFLNPRRAPAQTSRAKLALIAATCLLAIVGVGSWYVWSQFAELDQENARREQQVRELNKLVKDTQQKRAQAKAIEAWEAGRFSWLDELRYLTETMPPRSDMTINRLSISGGSRTATVSFNGVAKQPDAVDQMERALRDVNHAPRTPGLRDRPGRQQGWSFQTTMKVRPRPPEEYRRTSGEASP